jgi:hypothetical protein
MKQEMNPAVVIAIIAIVVVIAGFFIWRGTRGPGNVPPGGVGNAGPFAPGGQANSAQKARPPMGR